ncbi:MAG: NUDIX domain-containing protein [Actinomycetia bacterium]|nr:NUDIX domain-containing protein [Actinomycetes bacterium]
MQPRLRPAARALVLDPADRALLVQFRFAHGDVWATPGGGIDHGEAHTEPAQAPIFAPISAPDAGMGVGGSRHASGRGHPLHQYCRNVWNRRCSSARNRSSRPSSAAIDSTVWSSTSQSPQSPSNVRRSTDRDPPRSRVAKCKRPLPVVASW